MSLGVRSRTATPRWRARQPSMQASGRGSPRSWGAPSGHSSRPPRGGATPRRRRSAVSLSQAPATPPAPRCDAHGATARARPPSVCLSAGSSRRSHMAPGKGEGARVRGCDGVRVRGCEGARV
eukprot:scaffold123241_cov45-Phaeocystis_antarctica.AAC.2